MSQTHLVRPSVPPGTHPIETGRYVLSTPPLGRLCDDLKQWVDNRAAGAIVVGPPRFGKTKGIAFGADELREHFGATFPVLRFCCRDYSFPTEGRFFEDLLSDFGHAMSRSGTASAKRARLTQFLIQEACDADHRRLVLLGDEAQKLHEQQYKWLVDIYNELDRHDICTTVVLVGQPELVHQREAFQKAKKMQIVGRFMVHLHRFSGLRNQSDFEYCLQGYDEASEYPEHSEWSFTQYFFPAGFHAGWRLASEAKQLWKAFQQVRAEAKLPGKAEIPMQYFSRTVEYVLKKYALPEDGKPEISLNQWKEAIANSGYRDAGRYL